MMALSIEMALFSVTLICLCVYDSLRRVSYRPAIPLVWLSLAVGMGCFSAGLWMMGQTWGLRLAALPATQVNLWLGLGGAFLFTGTAGFALACQERARMQASQP